MTPKGYRAQWRSPDYWMGEPIPGTGSLNDRGPMRCVGGPMHGRTYHIEGRHLEVPCYGHLDDASFVGQNPLPDTVNYRVMVYVQRHFQQTHRTATHEVMRRERVLVPQDMPQKEAERLWLSLAPL